MPVVSNQMFLGSKPAFGFYNDMSVGINAFTLDNSLFVEYLVVGGGGQGGGGYGGGGGAGGFRSGSAFFSGSSEVVVGFGGSGSTGASLGKNGMSVGINAFTLDNSLFVEYLVVGGGGQGGGGYGGGVS